MEDFGVFRSLQIASPTELNYTALQY